MLPYSDSVGYIGSVITILLFVVAILLKCRNFFIDITKLPTRFVDLKTKQDEINLGLKNLKENVFKMEGKLDICCQIAQSFVSYK